MFTDLCAGAAENAMHGGEPPTRCPAESATATDCPTAGRTVQHRTSRSSLRGHVITKDLDARDHVFGRSGSRLWTLGITSLDARDHVFGRSGSRLWTLGIQ